MTKSPLETGTTVRVVLPDGIYPDRQITEISVPRALNIHDVVIWLRECRCGCRFIFVPRLPWQSFFNDSHRRRYEVKHRPPTWRKSWKKEGPREQHCECGCGTPFLVPPGSTRRYLNLQHKENARELRRKFARAGVPLE